MCPVTVHLRRLPLRHWRRPCSPAAPSLLQPKSITRSVNNNIELKINYFQRIEKKKTISKIQNFKNSKFNFKFQKISNFKNFKFQKFKLSKIQNFKNFKFQKFQISKNLIKFFFYHKKSMNTRVRRTLKARCLMAVLLVRMTRWRTLHTSTLSGGCMDMVVRACGECSSACRAARHAAVEESGSVDFRSQRASRAIPVQYTITTINQS